MERNTEKRIRVFGQSDDNIYIEGDRTHQFNGGNEPVTIEFSEGTKLSMVYTKGLWKIDRIQEGAMRFTEIFKADNPDDDDYSDVIELVGGFWWVRVGTQIICIEASAPQEFKELLRRCRGLTNEDEENGLEVVAIQCWQHFKGGAS